MNILDLVKDAPPPKQKPKPIYTKWHDAVEAVLLLMNREEDPYPKQEAQRYVAEKLELSKEKYERLRDAVNYRLRTDKE